MSVYRKLDNNNNSKRHNNDDASDKKAAAAAEQAAEEAAEEAASINCDSDSVRRDFCCCFLLFLELQRLRTSPESNLAASPESLKVPRVFK